MTKKYADWNSFIDSMSDNAIGKFFVDKPLSSLKKQIDAYVNARAIIQQSKKDIADYKQKKEELKRQREQRAAYIAARAASENAKLEAFEKALEEQNKLEKQNKLTKALGEERRLNSIYRKKNENLESNLSKVQKELKNVDSKSVIYNPSKADLESESESNAAQLNAFLAKPTKEYKEEQFENSAKKKDSDSEYKVKSDDKHQEVSTSQTPQTPQYPSTEAAKNLTLGNFFDYTSPYFQYYTAPTALGLGLGGLLGGWKGSLLGAAGGAGLGALAKYLVDNDKIHMA